MEAAPAVHLKQMNCAGRREGSSLISSLAVGRARINSFANFAASHEICLNTIALA